MDLWSDENLTPVRGVTAHRREMAEVSGLAGSRTILQLRSYLIGFHCLPGRHTGDHLTQGLTHVLDRLDILSKASSI